MSMNDHPYTRAYIFTGGRLGQWAIDSQPLDDVYLIGADRGADFLLRHGRVPHLAVGDFDSVTPDRMEFIRDSALELITCDAVDKDWSDTELAVREAIARGFREITLVGALGTRFDHGLANVQLLRLAHEHGCSLKLLDEHNEIRLCADTLRLERNSYFPYISLLPLTLEVRGITLEGFRYPLHQAAIQLGSSLGISNVLDAPVGTITITDGIVLVIRSRD
ncbi:thiamine diphosphokinase [Cohnella cholangitidis]|nr:thiamine diphosphokinase [Cohnella cholangitidis]